MAEEIVSLQEQVRALSLAVTEQNKTIQKVLQLTKRHETDGETFMEPQSFLTRFLAKWSPRVDERTRIHSYEELDWMDSDMLLCLILGVPVYGVEATTHMRLLISKDGLSRQESVQAMQALNIVPKGHYSGLEQVSEAIDVQRPRK